MIPQTLTGYVMWDRNRTFGYFMSAYYLRCHSIIAPIHIDNIPYVTFFKRAMRGLREVII